MCRRFVRSPQTRANSQLRFNNSLGKALGKALTQCDALQICEVSSDEVHDVRQLSCALLLKLLDAVAVQCIGYTCVQGRESTSDKR